MPLVHRGNLGAVAGIVGAGGNVGAVAAGYPVSRPTDQWPAVLQTIGVAVALVRGNSAGHGPARPIGRACRGEPSRARSGFVEQSHFGQSTVGGLGAASRTAVPEPDSLILLLGMLALWATNRR